MSTNSNYRKIIGYERRHEPLLPARRFAHRLLAATLVGMALLAFWVFLGMLGYHRLAPMSWLDAFLNAAMIVGGMGPVDVLTTGAAKIFAGVYAILSGVVILGVFGLLWMPVFHRFLHRFHLEADAAPAGKRRTDS